MTRISVLGRAALLAEPECAAPYPGLGALSARWLGAAIDQAPAQMSRWSRLDRYGRILAAVCDRAYDRGAEGPATGIYAVSERSCLETNAEFDRGFIEKGPRFASPLLFPYTLPGSDASEVAMLLGLTGPYAVFPGGSATALVALACALDQLVLRQADRLLIAAAEAIGPHTLRTLRDFDDLPRAAPLAEGAAVVWLGRADDLRPGPRAALHIEPAGPDPDWPGLILSVLATAKVSMAMLGGYISASTSQETLTAQDAAVPDLSRELPCLALVQRAGDAGAALGLLAVLAALEEATPQLILASDPGGAVAMVVAPS